MNVTSQISEVIKQHLPAAVGEELQKELANLAALRLSHDSLIAERDRAQKQILALTQANSEIRSRLDKIENREEQATKREREIELRDAVLKVKEECVGLRIADVKSVVEQVFSNSRFKYHEAYSHPVPVVGGSRDYPTTQVQQHSGSRSVEGQG